MKITRQAEAVWQSNVEGGEGRIQFGGAMDGRFDARSRLGDEAGTNPEALIAAAHAACYSQALSNALNEQGHEPQRVHTLAKVHLDHGQGVYAIPAIDLETQAVVPDIDDATFQPIAEHVRRNCGVSKVLAGAVISLRARLVSPGHYRQSPTP